MRYNNYCWDTILAFIHTKENLNKRFILIHDKINDIIFVFDLKYNKKRRVGYVFKLENEINLLKEIKKRALK